MLCFRCLSCEARGFRGMESRYHHATAAVKLLTIKAKYFHLLRLWNKYTTKDLYSANLLIQISLLVWQTFSRRNGSLIVISTKGCLSKSIMMCFYRALLIPNKDGLKWIVCTGAAGCWFVWTYGGLFLWVTSRDFTEMERTIVLQVVNESWSICKDIRSCKHWCMGDAIVRSPNTT